MTRLVTDASAPTVVRQWPVAAIREGLFAVLITFGCALLIALAGTRAPILSLPISALDLEGKLISSGIYAREFDREGNPYRWTSASATVQLRGAFNAAPAYVAAIRLRSEHPVAPQPLTLALQGRDVATVVPETRFRTYRLLVQPEPTLGHELWINLRTPSFVAPENPRPLGIIMSDLVLLPLTVLSPFPALWCALGLLALWVGLRQVRVPVTDVALVVGLSGLSLAALALAYPPTPQPFLALASVTLIALFAAGWLATTRAARIGLTALCISVGFAGVFWPSWLSDDALISFHYAQNFAAGHGVVYNIGERVEGYTNFLWTVLFAGIIAVGGDPIAWSYIVGAALALALSLLTYRLGVYLAGGGVGFLAALIVGTSQSVLLYTARGSGLETGLFALLVLAASGWYLAAQRHPRRLFGAGLLFALAALTRPEGVFVFGLTGMHLLTVVWMQRPRPWVPHIRTLLVPLLAFAGAFLLIFLPYFVWRFTYYGDLLPNTFYAKTGGGLRQIMRGMLYAAGFTLTLGGPLLLLIGWPWLRNWREALASWRGYLLPLVLAYTAYIVAVGGDHFRGERFFVPLLPWIALLLADAGRQLFAALPQHQRMRSRVLTALLIGMGATAALVRTAPLDVTIRGLDESVWIWRDIGWWVADHGAPDASLAAEGAGAPAFFSRRTTIDLLGLTDRHIARVSISDMGTGVAGHEKRDPDYVLNERQPTYIPRIWENYFGGAPVLQEEYDVIRVLARSGREIEFWARRP
jgi:hypothetical protein